MEELSEIKNLKFLLRDARNVRDANAIILIGLKASGVSNLDCGACGFATCKEMLEHGKVQKEFSGPHCMIKYPLTSELPWAQQQQKQRIFVSTTACFILQALLRVTLKL